jgi:hypothetical protein
MKLKSTYAKINEYSSCIGGSEVLLGAGMWFKGLGLTEMKEDMEQLTFNWRRYSNDT